MLLMKRAASRAKRAHPAVGALSGLIALTALCATQVSAEDTKVDPWCKVIEGQIERNRNEGNKPHDSNGTERLREERRRLDKDAHDRHCPGH